MVFHDIGKLGIADQILQKAELLNLAELVIMKMHTTLGEEILIAAKEKLTNQTEFIDKAIEMAVAYHECWDRPGYPSGLKGEVITRAVRILAVVDAYDAIVSSRCYKKQWVHEDAVEEINLHKEICFDPLITDAFNLKTGNSKSMAQSY